MDREIIFEKSLFENPKEREEKKHSCGSAVMQISNFIILS